MWCICESYRSARKNPADLCTRISFIDLHLRFDLLSNRARSWGWSPRRAWRKIPSTPISLMVCCLSQLTSLHYACYRGDYQAVLLLIEHRADPSVQNNMGYNSRECSGCLDWKPFFEVRYALSCLSYASPSQSNQYNNRLRIVDRLIEHYSNHASLVRAIRGVDHEPINLFSLMDLVFYSLIRQRDEFERLAWRVSLVIKRDQELIDYVQAIFQNSFVHSHYFAHLMYLGQRCFLVNPVAIISYYLEHVASDAQPNRFDLLLYLIYIDQGISSLRTIDACFRRQLNHHRQWLLRYFIDEYGEKPAELKFFCRRAIRQELLVGIHCRLDRLPLTSHLKAYLLIDELDPWCLFSLSVKYVE